MTSRPLRRVGLIVGGYVAAWGAGVLAVWLKNLGVSEADQLSMSGMFAFGDTVTFLGVASVVSIAPTLLLFQSIGRSPRFWRAYTLGTLGVSSTGLLATFFLVVPFHAESAFLQTLHMVSPLRVLAAPLFLLVAAPGLLPVASPNRKRAALACAFEIFTIAAFAIWVVWQRLLGDA